MSQWYSFMMTKMRRSFKHERKLFLLRPIAPRLVKSLNWMTMRQKKIQILMSAIKLLNFKVSLMPRLLNVGELSEDAAQMTIYFTDSLNIHLIV